MTSEATTGEPAALAVNGSQPQEGASQARAADARSPQVGGADHESGTDDIAQLRRERAAADREAQNLRTKLRQFEEAQKQADNAKLSDAERLTREHTEARSENESLRTQLRDERTRNRVQSAAARLGYRDPGDAYSLLDRSSLDYGDDGEPKHLDRLLRELLTSKPYLGNAQPSTPRGSGEGGARGVTPGPTDADMNRMIRQAAGRDDR